MYKPILCSSKQKNDILAHDACWIEAIASIEAVRFYLTQNEMNKMDFELQCFSSKILREKSKKQLTHTSLFNFATEKASKEHYVLEKSNTSMEVNMNESVSPDEMLD